MTTDSPSTVGSVATRTSSIRPAADAESEMRPSCGFRRSAMSSFASTFRRVVTPIALRRGIRWVSWSTPSMRKRTTSASACGSKWTSLAPSSAASKMIELTSRTSGASEMPSSTSRSSSSSSSITSNSAASLSPERAPNASAVRASRPSSFAISSLAATRRTIGCRLARRSESMPWMFCGSEIATQRESPSKAIRNGVDLLEDVERHASWPQWDRCRRSRARSPAARAGRRRCARSPRSRRVPRRSAPARPTGASPSPGEPRTSPRESGRSSRAGRRRARP